MLSTLMALFYPSLGSDTPYYAIEYSLVDIENQLVGIKVFCLLSLS